MASVAEQVESTTNSSNMSIEMSTSNPSIEIVHEVEAKAAAGPAAAAAKKSMNVGVYNNHMMSFAFFLLFSAYMTAQNFATTADPFWGPISLGILFMVWIVSLLTISNPAVQWLGARRAMAIGALTYPLFVASGLLVLDNMLSVVLYLSASAIVGVGAGLLWAGEAIFVVESCRFYEESLGLPTNSKLGDFNGVFNFYWNCSRFVGSAAAAAVFTFGGSVSALFTLMVVLGVMGAACFLLIKNMERAPPPPKGPALDDVASTTSTTKADEPRAPQREHSAEGGSVCSEPSGTAPLGTSMEVEEPSATATVSLEDTVSGTESGGLSVTFSPEDLTDVAVADKTPTKEALAEPSWGKQLAHEMGEIVAMWGDPTFLCLVPLSISFGLFLTFISGDLAVMIEDNAFKFMVLAVEGLTSGLSSMATGKVADRMGPLFLIICCVVLFDGVFVFFALWETDQNATAIWMTIAVVLGLADGAILTLVPQVYPRVFGGNNAAFANMRICQAIGYGVGFIYFIFTEFHHRLATNLAMMTVGALLIVAPGHIRKALL